MRACHISSPVVLNPKCTGAEGADSQVVLSPPPIPPQLGGSGGRQGSQAVQREAPTLEQDFTSSNPTLSLTRQLSNWGS